MGARALIHEKTFAAPDCGKAPRMALVVDGRLMQGTKSMHRHPLARRWRLRIRLLLIGRYA